MTSAFSSKSASEQITGMCQKLGFDAPQEILALQDKEAMSNAVVELALGMGKSETEISAALG